jgi:hypothetical protein
MDGDKEISRLYLLVSQLSVENKKKVLKKAEILIDKQREEEGKKTTEEVKEKA